MANKLYDETSIQAIANAIRTKNGSTEKYTVSEMATAITSLSTGSGTTPTGTITITENGTHDVTDYATASVNVPTGGDTPTYQEKTITENGTYTPDTGYDAFSQIIVNVASGGSSSFPANVKTGTLIPTENLTTEQTITHGCGTTPYAVMYIVDEITTVVSYTTIAGFSMGGTARTGIIWDNTGAVSGTSSYVTIGNITSTSFGMIPRAASYPLRTGYTYRWFAWY